MGKAHYNPGAEPATKKCKIYLFSLLILLGRTWNLLGDEINFLQMGGFSLRLNISQRVPCFHCRDIQPQPGHLMPLAISHSPVPAIWYPSKNIVWNMASLHKSIILPLPIEERGAASCWISCLRIPASSVICSEPHLDRIVFWLLIAGPDLCDSSRYIMRTEFKRDCMQRHPFHLLRKTFYLILIVYVPNHSSISHGSGIWRWREGVVVYVCCLGFFKSPF